MLFWYIEGAKYFSFDNMTLDPKAFVRSVIRTIAISHFYVWENIGEKVIFISLVRYSLCVTFIF